MGAVFPHPLLLIKKFIFMRFSICKRREYEPSVQNGLAVTPELMEELTRLGRPISASVTPQDFVDIEGDDVLPEFRRGTDINDLWDGVQEAKKKAKKLKFEEQSDVQSQNE